jgi:hypothetical protein
MAKVPLPIMLRIVACTAICLSPLIGWIAFGTVDPYGQRQHGDFPKLTELLAGRPAAFDALGDGVRRRSVVTRGALELKYRVLYGFQYVDTKSVVSGKGDWLFLKADFWQGRCLDGGRTRRLLAQVDILTDMAEVSGLKLIVTVSPDKSWIYAEKLNPWFHTYWNCKKESSALWRRFLPSQAPRIIDHGSILLEEKAKRGHSKLFYHTDTHWTPYGAALAFRQLLHAVYPDGARPIDAPLRIRGRTKVQTDIRNAMLLQRKRESVDVIDDEIGEEVKDPINMLIVHDSFYDRMSRQIAQVFPNATLVPHGEAAALELGGVDLLIFSAVERMFISEVVSSGPLSPTGGIFRSIIARNETAAADCRNFAPTPVKPGMPAVDEPGEPLIVRMPQAAPEHVPCLRFLISNWLSGSVEIFLPKKTGGDDVFEPGRSIAYETPRGSLHSLVLPDYVQGRDIKLLLPAGSHLGSIEVGQRNRISTTPIQSTQ